MAPRYNRTYSNKSALGKSLAIIGKKPKKIKLKTLPPQTRYELIQESLTVDPDDTFDKILKGDNYKPVHFANAPALYNSTLESEESKSTELPAISFQNILHKATALRPRHVKQKTYAPKRKRSKETTLDKTVNSSLSIEKILNTTSDESSLKSLLIKKDPSFVNGSNLDFEQSFEPAFSNLISSTPLCTELNVGNRTKFRDISNLQLLPQTFTPKLQHHPNSSSATDKNNCDLINLSQIVNNPSQGNGNSDTEVFRKPFTRFRKHLMDKSQSVSCNGENDLSDSIFNSRDIENKNVSDKDISENQNDSTHNLIKNNVNVDRRKLQNCEINKILSTEQILNVDMESENIVEENYRSNNLSKSTQLLTNDLSIFENQFSNPSSRPVKENEGYITELEPIVLLEPLKYGVQNLLKLPVVNVTRLEIEDNLGLTDNSTDAYSNFAASTPLTPSIQLRNKQLTNFVRNSLPLSFNQTPKKNFYYEEKTANRGDAIQQFSTKKSLDSSHLAKYFTNPPKRSGRQLRLTKKKNSGIDNIRPEPKTKYPSYNGENIDLCTSSLLENDKHLEENQEGEELEVQYIAKNDSQFTKNLKVEMRTPVNFDINKSISTIEISSMYAGDDESSRQKELNGDYIENPNCSSPTSNIASVATDNLVVNVTRLDIQLCSANTEINSHSSTESSKVENITDNSRYLQESSQVDDGKELFLREYVNKENEKLMNKKSSLVIEPVIVSNWLRKSSKEKHANKTLNGNGVKNKSEKSSVENRNTDGNGVLILNHNDCKSIVNKEDHQCQQTDDLENNRYKTADEIVEPPQRRYLTRSHLKGINRVLNKPTTNAVLGRNKYKRDLYSAFTNSKSNDVSPLHQNKKKRGRPPVKTNFPRQISSLENQNQVNNLPFTDAQTPLNHNNFKEKPTILRQHKEVFKNPGVLGLHPINHQLIDEYTPKKQIINHKDSPSSQCEEQDQFNENELLFTANASLSLKPGKWRRSFSILRKSLVSLCHRNSELCLLHRGGVCTCAKCKTQDVSSRATPHSHRRISSRIVPIEHGTSATRRVSILQSYASKTTSGYAHNQSDLSEYLNDLSLKNLPPTEKSALPLLTARDIVLQRCHQKEPLSFSTVYPDSLIKTGTKIGEGVYGEVFVIHPKPHLSTVVKVIPIENQILVNGERQKKFEEILSEIVIAQELSNLRNGRMNGTSSFSELYKVCCVKGKYPQKLLELWDQYDDDHGSENDNPRIFKSDQLYICLEFANAGKDLEAYTFQNAQQAYSVFRQIVCALAVAEAVLQFEHRDMHWGNILIQTVDKLKMISYNINGYKIDIPSHGVQVTIIDFTMSRVTCDGVYIYNDLSEDPELFTAEGDYQFEIYRKMRQHTGDEWKSFYPFTNVLWMHYILDKLISALRYRNINSKVHRDYIHKLRQEYRSILKCNSILTYVQSRYPIQTISI